MSRHDLSLRVVVARALVRARGGDPEECWDYDPAKPVWGDHLATADLVLDAILDFAEGRHEYVLPDFATPEGLARIAARKRPTLSPDTADMADNGHD
jgi:hypothetical protein